MASRHFLEYNVLVNSRRMAIEVIDDDMAAVLRQKTGAQRLAIVDALYDAAWRLIECNVQTRHPEWSDQQVRRAVAQRIAGAAD
jgi:hypothetical protein